MGQQTAQSKEVYFNLKSRTLHFSVNNTCLLLTVALSVLMA